MKLTLTLLYIVSIVLVVVLGVQNARMSAKLSNAEEKLELPYVGMYVPKTTASDMTGSTVEIGQPAKKVQVLYFFNTTCPYCLASTPAINRIQKTFNNEAAVEFYLISRDQVEETKAYIDKLNITSTTLRLSEMRELSLFHALSVPVLLAIDSGGKVFFSHIGEIDEQDDVDSIVGAVRNMENDPLQHNDREGVL